MSEGLRPEQAAFRIVEDGPAQASASGKALVFGHFPPVITPSSQASAAVLWMLEAGGFQVRSATGPGLSLAAQTINFTSETRFNASSAFLRRLPRDGIAVVHARALDFSRIAKPTWYKRRMEELRRMRLVSRIVGAHAHTALVLDGRAIFSRETAALILGALAGSLRSGRRLSILRKTQGAEGTYTCLTGRRMPAPPSHAAEERAYRAAFDGAGRQAVRLTPPRAEQIARFSTAKAKGPQAERLLEDVSLLAELAQRHDLRSVPLMRLVENALPVPPDTDALPAEDAGSALNARDRAHRFAVPLTRYMMHLRETLGLSGAYPLANRADARRFFNWYLREAPTQVPGGWVPVTPGMRSYLRQEGGVAPVSLGASNLAHLRGHDARPFALSAGLIAVYLSSEIYQAAFDIDDPLDRVAFVVRAAIEAEDGADLEALLGPRAMAWFLKPVGGQSGNISRFAFLMALQCRFELRGLAEIDAPWASASIARWADVLLRDRLPVLAPLLGPPAAKRLSGKENRARAGSGVHLVGLPNSGTGVGSNLLMSRSAFRHLGLDPQVLDVADGMATGREEPHGAAQGLQTARPVVLHHVNADRIPQCMATLPLAGTRDAFHAGFLLWEFPVLPGAHRLALDLLDEIWVPSRFVQQVYAREAPCPVINMGKAISLPQVPKADLGAYGVPSGAMCFLTCFDFHSSLQRKNPLAVVEAFLAAFAGRKDVRLIIKTTPPAPGHWGDSGAQWARIEALAAKDKRLILCTERLAFRALISLVSAVDCLVSAHRAEGFGLLPAYALALATPVIATDYSGTTDFCTDATAMPVPYSLVPVGVRDALFPMTGAMWAEIDKAALTAQMAGFAADPMEGRLRAARGRMLIAQKYSVGRQAARYRDRLMGLEVVSGAPAEKAGVHGD